MLNPNLSALIEHLKETRGKNWQKHQSFLRQLLLLVAQGTPVSPDSIATTLGLRTEMVYQRLEPLRAYGCEFDSNGNLVGAILTQSPTPHRFRLAGHDLYAWCALDTLFLPALLQQSAEVRSLCPVTRREIMLIVTPEKVEVCDPPEAVVSVVTMECHAPGPRGDFCGQIFFFASQEDAATWIGDRNGIEVVTIADAFMLAQAVYVEDESIASI